MRFAGNFREYITTLECGISGRDCLIYAIRTELSFFQSENVALKCSLLSRSVAPPDPAPLPEVSTAISSTASSTSNSAGFGRKRPRTILRDLPTSPCLESRAPFWGGFGSDVTPVHTTLVPPFAVLNVVLAGEGERT
ncbi:hypothetical protein BV22DRAFT_1042142 [Leucogyrophana mollusca]|uniref:Uncharacterized protein n=1 Tax=Leucogyrophana mollusca TaxID=85980 RepID=A0ACB8AWV1_9AGAM|nr:hypothetical protein BV22DRAFT_1042142 [Leucogyrophana mollusca]